MFTSNNPEAFTSTGFVYEAARADPARGGTSWPLAGDFGVYLHHDNDSSAAKWLQLVITNPTTSDLVVSGAGSAYTNREHPLARGAGPDYAVADDVLAGTPRTTIPATTVQPQKAAAVWLAPDAPTATLATVSLGGTPHTTHLRLFVPGLSSIPLGLYLVAR